RVAFQQQRPTLSQAWLRLAAIHAETPTQEKLLARDYRQVRSANPLHFNLNLSVAPSDNVNNGTDNVLEVNNGVPTLGRFGGSSRALSGTVGILDLRLRYRLARSAAGVTTATGRLYTRQVDLSDSAQAQAPDVSNGDFGSTYVELGLERRLGFGKRGNTASVSGAFGASWSGGNRSYDFAKLGLSRGLRLSPSTRLSLRGGVERRLSTRSAAWDADVLTLGSSLSHKRENGDRFSLGLTVQNVTGERLNADYDTASLRAAYTFAKPLGPAQVTAGVTLGVTDYDKYTLVGPVPGGREDQSFYGDVSFFFKDYDYAGFAPTVRLRTGKRTSNVNRFDISESTISLGLQSKF
ncbi:MAG: surface lipoprotein assembly modifier, partial [Pseudomonadota bacterium]